jgi:hypothetical protein
MWYLNFGTHSRYADVVGRRTSVRNVMCFADKYVVVHLGTSQHHSSETKFLVFDRVFLHRVLKEMHVFGNSLVVHYCGASPHDVSSFRAMWASMPSTGNSRLFHRWLLILSAQDDVRYPVIEHRATIFRWIAACRI